MRHRWGEPHRTEHETSRACLRCGLIRVTRHDGPGFPWVEWHRDGLRVPAERTPPCEVTAEADAR